MGLKPTVETDLGFYVGTDDETLALERGVQGLPLKPGDAVLLCSDGLIKSKAGVRYAKDEEIIQATDREFAPHMAAKAMVSIATGREADDNVSAVTIQYLDPQMIAEAHRQTQAYKRRQLMIRYGIFGGGAILTVLVLMLGWQLFTSTTKIKSLENLPTATPNVQTEVVKVEVVITNTPAPTLEPTLPIAANEKRVEEVTGIVSVLSPSGVESQAVKGMMLSTGSKVTTGLDSGIRIVFGDASGTGVVYLYSETTAVLNMENKLDLDLWVGAAYVQPASGRTAEVKLPNHSNATASVSGSRMVVDVRPEKISGVKIWCFEGKCRIENPDLSGFGVPEGQSRLFHPENGQVDEPKLMTYEEQWMWAKGCSVCLGSLVPAPTVRVNTIVPPTPTQKDNNSQSSSQNPTKPPVATTQVPPPVATTQVPPPVATTQVPPPVATTQVPPPVATTKVPPPVATTKVPPPVVTTEVPPPVVTTEVPPPVAPKFTKTPTPPHKK